MPRPPVIPFLVAARLVAAGLVAAGLVAAGLVAAGLVAAGLAAAADPPGPTVLHDPASAALALPEAPPGPTVLHDPASAALARPTAPPVADTLDVFRLDTLAPGVWAATVVPRPAAWAFANSLVVAGSDAVLVVDAQASPTASRALVDIVGGLTDLPVRWVVNTHGHGDHVNGNQAWADAHPGVRFVAHPATRTLMLGEGRERLERERRELPASLAERRRRLAAGTGPDGRPLTAEQRDRVAYGLRVGEAYLRDLETLRTVLPDSLVADRATFDLGGRRVVVLHPGAAHTAGDLAVHLPVEGVLAAGDLLEEAAPWIEGADLPGWASALELLQGLEPRIVLPAHGRVRRDRALLDGEAALFRDLVDAGRRALGRGWSDDEAVERIGLEGHRAFLATLNVRGEAFDAFRAAAVRDVIADLRGRR